MQIVVSGNDENGVNDMNDQEKSLVDAIKNKTGHQVWPGRNGGSVQIAITIPGGVKMMSVWLGRSSSIERLQSILSA